jgi:hypothetical protein
MPPFLKKAPPPDFDGPLRLREFVKNLTGDENDYMTSQLHALVAEVVTAFSNEIMLHGDANQRAWLAAAAQEFIDGKEISNQSTKEDRMITPEETLRGAQHQGEPTPVSESALEAAKRIMDANLDLVGLAVELDAFAAAAVAAATAISR